LIFFAIQVLIQAIALNLKTTKSRKAIAFLNTFSIFTKTIMKIIKSILLLSLAVNFFLFFVSIKLFFQANNLFEEKPELLKSITTHEMSLIEIEFNKLVQKKFPIGLSEREVIRELDMQGFYPRWSVNNEHSAFFETFNIACSFYWTIVWKVDKHGNVAEIKADHTDSCL
jgi:hypothetical protein